MARVRDTFTVQGEPTVVLAAIKAGAEKRGRETTEAGASKLAIVRGVNAFSWSADVEVEVSAEGPGGSKVYLNGSTFGIGPLVKQGPKREMAEIRGDAESAAP